MPVSRRTGSQQEERRHGAEREVDDALWEDHELDVDARECQQAREKNEERGKVPVESLAPCRAGEEHGARQFHDRVADGNWLAARSASTLQEDPRHDRNVVSFEDDTAAPRTRGSR